MSTDESFAEVFNGGKLVGEAIGHLNGVIAERERIIALLESKDEWHYAFSDVSDVIALIKGEGNWADSVQETKKDWPE